MRDQMNSGISEATRLTREGRLAEATALIQRTLGGTFAQAPSDGPDGAEEPIETARRAVNQTAQPGSIKNALRRVPGSPDASVACPVPCPRRQQAYPTSFLRGDNSSSGPTRIGQGPAPTNCTFRAATSGRRCPLL
jgi:hypothetical protein